MNKKSLDMSAAMNSYQLPYIGVMTIIWIFLIIQYFNYAEILERKNTERNQSLAQAVARDLKTLDDVKIEIMDNGVKVTLPSSIMFDLSVAGIKKAVVPVLRKFSDSIKGLSGNYTVVVDGHTDDAPVFYGGDYSSNWELALYRSISIIDFFVGEGNNPDRFVAAGHGQFSPLAANDTPEHRAGNRRVEIFIRRKSAKTGALEALDTELGKTAEQMRQGAGL